MSAMLLRPLAMPSSVDAVLAGMPHAVWRANQMASPPMAVVPSGFHALDGELPNGGWPQSALIELLLHQPGIGEMQLLRPALEAIARKRRIVLIQPPHVPQIAAWSTWDLLTERMVWIDTEKAADALWSAEQVLRNGSCGAVVLWQARSRSASLRRLHLAAQEADTVFWLMRPLAEADESSPASLRLGLRPANGGIEVSFVKRRGPQTDSPLRLLLDSMPSTDFPSPPENDAYLDCPAPAAASTGSVAAMLE
jgi:protein ImuA